MNTYGGMEVSIHAFLTSALDEWSGSRPSHFIPGKERRYPLDKKVGEDHSRYQRGGEEINPFRAPTSKSNPGRPARSLVTIMSKIQIMQKKKKKKKKLHSTYIMQHYIRFPPSFLRPYTFPKITGTENKD
jgi:hypothetical protein